MWPNPQFPAGLITFTKEILNGKLHFLWSVYRKSYLIVCVSLELSDSIHRLRKETAEIIFTIGWFPIWTLLNLVDIFGHKIKDKDQSEIKILFLKNCSRCFLIPEPISRKCSISKPLETSENQTLSDVFNGYRNRTLAWNGLTH